MGIIYCYTNKITGKKYVGQTINPNQRKSTHKSKALKEQSDYYFHRSIRKHGWNSFDYEVLEENVSDLNERENYYINTLNTIWPNGYNQCTANSLDRTAIEKMRETKKRQFESMTEEDRRKSVDAMVKANTGRKHSEETKKKRSLSVKKYLAENPRPKRIWTQEMKDKQSRLLKEKYEQGVGRWAK
jgi:group I intron endonuclease